MILFRALIHPDKSPLDITSGDRNVYVKANSIPEAFTKISKYYANGSPAYTVVSITRDFSTDILA